MWRETPAGRMAGRMAWRAWPLADLGPSCVGAVCVQINLPIEAFDPDGDNTAFAIMSGNTNGALRLGTPFAAGGTIINRVYVGVAEVWGGAGPGVGRHLRRPLHVVRRGHLAFAASLCFSYGRYIEVSNSSVLDFETLPAQRIVLSCNATDGKGAVTVFSVTVNLRYVFSLYGTWS
jgi:hypothetical protein